MRNRILDAALALVRDHGLLALSQARVAAAAGLRQSHLTYYFPTRGDLIKAIVRALHTGTVAAMRMPRPGEPGSVAQLREFLARCVRNPLMARLLLALLSATDEDPTLRGWLGELEAEMIAQLREAVDAAGLSPSDDELALLHVSLVGAAVLGAQGGTDESAARAARMAELAFDRLLDASVQGDALPVGAS